MSKLKIAALIFTISILVFLVTGIPYFYGWTLSTPTVQFSGFVDGHDDTYQYFSFARQAAEGKFLFENRYAIEPHAPLLINWVWWSLGKFMATTGWDIPLTYQVFRLVVTVVFTSALYVFLGKFFQGPTRYLLLCLILWGGGFGGLVRVLKKATSIIPVDFDLPDVWLVESHAFNSLMIWPHFSLAAALMLFSILSFLKALEHYQIKYYIFAGLLGLLLLFFHPFEFLILFNIFFFTGMLHSLSTQKQPGWGITGLIIFLISCSPGLIYYFYLNQQPVWHEVMGQMSLITPDPFKMALGFGIMFILAFLTFSGLPALKNIPVSNGIIFSWFIAGFFLFYLPVKFQWHLVNGWQIPLYIVAMIGIEKRILPYFRGRNSKKIIYFLLILSLSTTSLYLIQSKMSKIKNNFGRLPFFISLDKKNAFTWLKTHSKPGDTIMAKQEIGNILPALTGNKVFLGHRILTPNHRKKMEETINYYNKGSYTEEDSNWLGSKRILFVLMEPDGNLNKFPGSIELPFYKKVYKIQNVAIFKSGILKESKTEP
jgi:hypothetical protein